MLDPNGINWGGIRRLARQCLAFLFYPVRAFLFTETMEGEIICIE
jgi:hypothetical protein